MIPSAPQRSIAAGCVLALTLACGAIVDSAWAEQVRSAAAPAADIEAPVAPEVRKAQRQQDLEAVQGEQKCTAEAEARLKSEIAAIGEDRRTLNQALIETASRIRAAETRVAAGEARRATLSD